MVNISDVCLPLSAGEELFELHTEELEAMEKKIHNLLDVILPALGPDPGWGPLMKAWTLAESEWISCQTTSPGCYAPYDLSKILNDNVFSNHLNDTPKSIL